MLRAIDKWLPGYLASVLRRPRRPEGVRHLFFCVADHFEPFRGGVARAEALELVRRWCAEFPRLAGRFRDSDGRPPRHTFFYPAENDDEETLDRLSGLCRAGYGEVEIHLHHRDDTAPGLRNSLVTFRDALAQRHGLLGRDAAGQPRYAFVHGNWALCNSRPDGDWCGVNEELGVLADTGCYADLTFPSAPSPTQPRTVNAIYRATDTPGRSRAHDRGVRVEGRGVRGEGRSSTLLLIQGPLALNWRRRKWGLLPRLENGEISGANPPTPLRIELWVRQAVGVKGRPDWVFVKVHTHGCVAANMRMLLGESMAAAHARLGAVYGGSRGWRLHYVTAREMYNLVVAAENGFHTEPAGFLDYEIRPGPGLASP